jgi:parallel beta-helix repeat protein
MQSIKNLANGVFLNDSDNTAVSDNAVYQNGANGVFLLDSEFNNITDNTIHDNGDSNGGLATLSRRLAIPLAVGSFGHGIYLDPSHNNLIDNNNVYNNLANGVHLENSGHNTISNNAISGHGNSNGGLMVLSQRTPTTLAVGSFGHGIYLDPSDYNLVDNNTVYNNFVNGIFLNDSDHTAVSDNEVYENGANGVFLLDSESNNITDNTIHDNGNGNDGLAILSRRTPTALAVGSFGHGIYLDPSNNNLIDNNTVYNNLANGVHLENSGYNTISNNTISGHGNSNGGLMVLSRRTPTTLAVGSFGHGIYLDPSNNNTIVNNEVRNNTGNGIFLNASDSTIVSGNTILGNTLYGINITTDSDHNSVAFNNYLENNPEGTSQARDDGIGNLFASNFWDDWSGFGAYPIDGDAGNQDESPLEEPIAPSEHLLLEPTVLYPNGREKLSGTVTIQWLSSVDSLGHDIVYTVSYSKKWVKSYSDHHSYHRRKDCKVFDHRRKHHSNRWERDWIILAEGIETTSFEWDTTTVRNGNKYMIKVEAFCSEGLTADDTSDRTFKIKNKKKSTKRHYLHGAAAGLLNLPSEVTSSGFPGWSLFILGLSLIGALPIRQLKRTLKD